MNDNHDPNTKCMAIWAYPSGTTEEEAKRLGEACGLTFISMFDNLARYEGTRDAVDTLSLNLSFEPYHIVELVK